MLLGAEACQAGRPDRLTAGIRRAAAGASPRARKTVGVTARTDVTRRREAGEGASAAPQDTVAWDAAQADEGLVLGRYRLGRRLGTGGFGSVYAAHDERLDRAVAVKIIPSGGSAPERARREAIAAARLDHPGIVALHDAGEEPGARYLVSELVEGRTLADLEAEGALSDRDVLRVGIALADALAHAHERGVIHRDVKPQNVIIPDRKPAHHPHRRERAKLTDFGVAHLAGDEPLTMTGDVVGTLAYMAPEQAEGRRVDERADLYALALVVYEGLAGRNPVKAASPAATAQRIGTQLPSLGKQRRDLPAPLVTAIDRALKPQPAHRGDLEDLAVALEDALPEVSDEGGTIAPLPFEPDPRPGRLDRPAAALAAGAGAGGALALFAGPDAAALGGGSTTTLALAAAAAAALATLALPRLGWIAAALAVVALVGADHPSTAGLLLAAAAVPPLLAPSAGGLWTLPAAAPLLGYAAIAGAYPALAGRARRWHTRAALGAAGAWWLLLAAPMGEDDLLLALGGGIPPQAGVLVVLWAGAAVVLPWIVRNRHLALDVVAAVTWTAGLAAATASLAAWIGAPDPRGLVAGAIAAALAALWPRY